MQIHELNTFSGKPGEMDFLAVDSGFDTAKISVEELLKYSAKVPVDEHGDPLNGDPGQLLRSNGDGSTEWSDVGLPTDEQTEQAVNKWLDDHPEATTTVADGSLTDAKFSNTLKLETIKDYVTPEMFGAVGDGVADDIQPILDCLSSGARHIVMSKSYYVSTPINNVPSNILIDGKGSIKAASTAFEIDGARGFIIRDLSITFAEYGFHVTSTASYVQYAEIQNIVLNGTDADSIGVYLERTTTHLNEIRFTNVVCWGVKKGFVIYNPDTSSACAAHRFLFCSAESATDCGFDLTNADCISLIFSRIAENYGFKIRSTGECNRLVVITDAFYNQKEQPLSNQTNGVVLGCLRCGEIYDATFGGYAKIVKGKIIPCDSLLTEAFNTSNLNSDLSEPILNDVVYHRNSWAKYGASATTLTLNPDYYGGRGLINDLYIYMGGSAGAVTVKNGDQTVVIPSNIDGKTYHLKFFNVSGSRRWRYEELSSF